MTARTSWRDRVPAWYRGRMAWRRFCRSSTREEVYRVLAETYARGAMRGSMEADTWLRSERGREVCAAVGIDASDVRERARAMLASGETLSKVTRWRHEQKAARRGRKGTEGLGLWAA